MRPIAEANVVACTQQSACMKGSMRIFHFNNLTKNLRLRYYRDLISLSL